MAHGVVQVSRGAFLLGAAAGGLGSFAGMRSDLLWAHAAGTAPRIRAAASLGPLINIPQTWNNCGPAAIAEVLSYWGISRTQAQVQAMLRVDGPSAGMTPYGVPAYARSVGLRALSGVGGTEILVKRLIGAGFPAIVHQVVSLSDLVGHWRPIEAYDDRQGMFTASDPYLGPNHLIGYADFAQMWALRGQAFVVLYPASHQAKLTAVLSASRWNKIAAYTQDMALLKAGRLDAAPAGTPASASDGYHYLGMAWDAAQLSRRATARSYLQSATSAGANPIEVRWVGALIG
jgi:uncharacterized protein